MLATLGQGAKQNLGARVLDVTCGRLVVAGILESQIEVVQSRLLALGATILEFNNDGEWISIVV